MSSLWSWGSSQTFSSLLTSVTENLNLERIEQVASTVGDQVASSVSKVTQVMVSPVSFPQLEEEPVETTSASPPWSCPSDKAKENILMKHVKLLSKEKWNFLRPPPSSLLSDFQFDLAEFAPAALAAMKFDPSLRELRFALVPEEIKEEAFWRNYFAHVHVIKTKLMSPEISAEIERQIKLQSDEISNTTHSDSHHNSNTNEFANGNSNGTQSSENLKKNEGEDEIRKKQEIEKDKIQQEFDEVVAMESFQSEVQAELGNELDGDGVDLNLDLDLDLRVDGSSASAGASDNLNLNLHQSLEDQISQILSVDDEKEKTKVGSNSPPPASTTETTNAQADLEVKVT
eukprot:TRINITY_DN1850_c0_g2_i2.p1 TRINITY_DN1850_c0_g2~~TRINITY_DN1850_c0_g2_i2.p1  ORF type:complete len:356 (-),score=80.68 TRINITY_DN1850_c0_g2_i2:214-1245(-)